MPYLKNKFRQCAVLALVPSLLGCSAASSIPTVNVAVATNFAGTFEVLETEFEARHDYDLVASFGSTGQLYAQITQGAPYGVFLSADAERAEKLGESFTYAIGELVLWAPDKDMTPEYTEFDPQEISRLAIANPDLAPYGRAAMEVLENVGKFDRLSSTLVQGENVGQTLAMVATHNADAGLVARSLVKDDSYICIPKNLYSPIRQNAVQLIKSPGTDAFITFLKSKAAGAIIRDAGYSLSDDNAPND